MSFVFVLFVCERLATVRPQFFQESLSPLSRILAARHQLEQICVLIDTRVMTVELFSPSTLFLDFSVYGAL